MSVRRSIAFPTTSRRCAGSLAALAIPLAASLLRGRPDRLRAGPATAPHARVLRGDRALADPHRPRRQGPRPTGATAAGSPRLHRAGELVAIRVPTVQEEAVRDLCRARADMVIDRTRARHRLGMFLLRHGRPWRGGNAWTLTHQRWLLAQHFDEPALAATYAHYRAVLDARDAQLAAIQADLAGWYDRAPFADAVHRLSAYRGITRLGALTLPQRGRRLAPLPPGGRVRGVCGLVPSEYSSGTRTWRGHITKTGNAHLRAQLARVGLVLPAPASGRGRPAPPPAGPGSPGGRPRLGRPVAAVRALPAAPPPARTPRTWSSPRSPGSSLGSCGPRWRPDMVTSHRSPPGSAPR
jgi:hypothetical protein